MPARIPTKVLSVRLTLDALEAIEKAAVDAKTTKSAYAARVLLEAATGKAPVQTEPPKPDKVEAPLPTIAKGITISDPKALEELRRIGININQIAHALNAGRPTETVHIVKTVASLLALLKDPDAFMQGVAQMQPISVTPAATPTTAPPVRQSPPPAMTPTQPPETRRPVPTAPAPMPSVTTPPAIRLIPAHVYGEIARAVSRPPMPVVPPVTVPPNPDRYAEPEGWASFDLTRYEPRSAPPTKAPPAAAPRLRRRVSQPVPRGAAPTTKPLPKQEMKDPRRDPPHPQARHQLQDRAPLHPPRPGPAKDDKPGRLGFLSKLWRR